ncbi:MAG: YceI family protein [Actinomycetota bacterium]|nr:YceI family protein [Actinomycetota bacterium]
MPVLERGRAGGRRRALIVVAAVAALATGAFAAAYIAFFADDSPDRLALTEQAEGPATPTRGGAVADLTGRWVVAEGSEAGYRVREKLANLPAQSDAVGRTTAVTGGLAVAAGGNGLVARDLRMEVDLTQLRSDEARRDNRIRTQGLESNRFPKATFVSTGDVPVPASAAAAQPFEAGAEGDLTLHGVTRRVRIPVRGQIIGDGAEVVGSLEFPMAMFGIDPPNIGGFVTVEPNATLEFKIVLRKA